MHFSKKSLKKIREILLEITPEITEILDEVRRIGAMRVQPGKLSEEEASE